MKRAFVVHAEGARIDESRDANLLARFAAAALGLSHSIRRDVLFGVSFGERVLWMRGDRIRQWRPDVGSATGIMRKALAGGKHPGVWLGELEEAEALVPYAEKRVFVFENQRELPALRAPIIAHTALHGGGLAVENALPAAFPRTTFPDQAIAVANILLDRERSWRS